MPQTLYIIARTHRSGAGLVTRMIASIPRQATFGDYLPLARAKNAENLT
jgi:hypothetical protein